MASGMLLLHSDAESLTGAAIPVLPLNHVLGDKKNGIASKRSLTTEQLIPVIVQGGGGGGKGSSIRSTTLRNQGVSVLGLHSALKKNAVMPLDIPSKQAAGFVTDAEVASVDRNSIASAVRMNYKQS